MCLMQIGRSFRSFTLLEIDQELGDGKISEFYEVFKTRATDVST
jgi:hypothetical protein